MTEHHKMLEVNKIDFDTENPRIKMALEKYGSRLNAERIHFALSSATEGSSGTSSYSSLRDSIRSSHGVIAPIIVRPKGHGYVCIDGNTRLAIYKQFQREEIEGDWSEIKAIVLDHAEQRDIETVRVSAHLVGAREWPAYEKARYLHYLRNQKCMDYSEMIALCGGNKSEIERQIAAYHDMNLYYRDKVDDTAFRIDRYSGFVELQRPQVKQAIFDAELDMEDFGEWIRDGKIYRLEDVRKLPKILRDDEARRVFLEGGPRSIENAMKVLDQRTGIGDSTDKGQTTIEHATIYELADALSRRINEMPYSQLRELREKTDEDTADQITRLEDLSVRLRNLLDDVTE